MVDITEPLEKVNEEFPKTLGGLDDRETYWNYRVVKRGHYYGIYEVYYCKGGKIQFIGSEATPVDGDSKDSLKWILRMMQANWVLPTIDYETLEEIDDIV